MVVHERTKAIDEKSYGGGQEYKEPEDNREPLRMMDLLEDSDEWIDPDGPADRDKWEDEEEEAALDMYDNSVKKPHRLPNMISRFEDLD